MVEFYDQTTEIIIESKTIASFLWDEAERKMCKLYAIVDSARNEDVFKYLLSDNVDYRSLFHGTTDIKFFGVSGFLVACEKDSVLFNWLTNEAWGESCSIFLLAKTSFNDILKHFQRFNRVYLEDDDVVYFRYYDPRVLRIYLPTCNEKEINLFFGEIESFLMESENPEILIEFHRNFKDMINALTISNHKVALQK